jgi:hypothetical protein
VKHNHQSGAGLGTQIRLKIEFTPLENLDILLFQGIGKDNSENQKTTMGLSNPHQSSAPKKSSYAILESHRQ